MKRSVRYRAPFFPDGCQPVDAGTCSQLLSLALHRGGDYADLFFEYRAGGGLSFQEGILKSSSRFVSVGLGIRVQVGDATGYAYTENLGWRAMSRAAKLAGQIARTQSRPFPPPALARQSIPDRYSTPCPPIDVSGCAKRDLLDRASRAAFAVHSSIVRVEASYSETIREILFASSDGRLSQDSQPMFRFGVRAVAIQDGRRCVGSSGGGGRLDLTYFDTSRPERHAERASHQALVMLEAREAPAGPMAVVLAPGESGILLHEAVGHGLEADFNRKGTSAYSGRLGDVVASHLCTVVDDSTIEGARGSINVDDEGNVPSRTVLIENGVLVGYLHDQTSAQHFDSAGCGNGRRQNFAAHPLPRMTNTYLQGGQSDPEDILRGVQRGIYAKRLGGGQVDIANGDFVFGLTESYLIEEGRISAPLRDVNLIGNGPEALRLVDAVGHDFAMSDGIWTCGKEGQSVPVGVGCPTVRISEITVGGTDTG